MNRKQKSAALMMVTFTSAIAIAIVMIFVACENLSAEAYIQQHRQAPQVVAPPANLPMGERVVTSSTAE